MEEKINAFIQMWNELAESGESIEILFGDGVEHTIRDGIELIWNDTPNNQSVCWNTVWFAD